MRNVLLAVVAALACAAFIATDAEAKRLGGGRSFGAQRNMTAAPASTPGKPVQAQPGQAQQAAAAGAPAAQASGFARWAPLLGGLALGGALGWLMG
ncbi:MAG: Tim44 domain-containing protein, partial [Burkholderiales bacterium]